MKTDREKDGLVGAVQSVRQECAYISRKDDKWLIHLRKLESMTTYDRDGKRTDQSYMNQVIHGSPNPDDVNKYDEEGNLVEHEKYSNGLLQYKVLFYYDAEGREVERIVHNPDATLNSRTVCNYDERGRATEMSTYMSDGTLDCKHTYTNKYDSNGNLVEMTVRRWTNSNGELLYEPLFVNYYSVTYY